VKWASLQKKLKYRICVRIKGNLIVAECEEEVRYYEPKQDCLRKVGGVQQHQLEILEE